MGEINSDDVLYLPQYVYILFQHATNSLKAEICAFPPSTEASALGRAAYSICHLQHILASTSGSQVLSNHSDHHLTESFTGCSSNRAALGPLSVRMRTCVQVRNASPSPDAYTRVQPGGSTWRPGRATATAQ